MRKIDLLEVEEEREGGGDRGDHYRPSYGRTAAMTRALHRKEEGSVLYVTVK